MKTISRIKNFKSDVAYRHGSLKQPSLLLQVRSAGFYQATPQWKDRPKKKQFAELFWCARGTLHFTGEPERIVLHQDEVCFLFPGDFHKLSATEESEFYWFTFDGPYVRTIIEAFQLTRASRPAPPCPRELFMRLIREIRKAEKKAYCQAGATAYQLLTLALTGRDDDNNPPSLFKRFTRNVSEYFGDPAVGIAQYALMLKCHRSTLSRAVRSHAGMTPQAYLCKVRLEKAEHLLLFSLDPIKDVALQCGFSDPNYFSRVFHQAYGRNPSDYR